MGKIIIYLGIILVVIGVILTWMPGLLRWVGRLPGDIHINLGNGSIFIPITSMIIISLVLTLILNIFFRK